MDRRSQAGVVIVIGVLMVLLALLADTLGIGHAGFGWKRGVLLAAGVVVVAIGAWLALPPADERAASGGTADPAAEPPAPDSEPASVEQELTGGDRDRTPPEPAPDSGGKAGTGSAGSD
jgi:hypothetical protein